jgi:hypothetical protein
VSREQIESVGFGYLPCQEAEQRFNRQTLRDGWNTVDGRRVFYISNPALGLWASRDRLVD